MPVPLRLRNLIGDSGHAAASDDVIDVVNPATSEVITRLHSSTQTTSTARWPRARTAAPAWAALTTGQRARLVNPIAVVVASHADELRDLEIVDTGKPITPTDADDFPLIRDSIRFFTSAARAERAGCG